MPRIKATLGFWLAFIFCSVLPDKWSDTKAAYIQLVIAWSSVNCAAVNKSINLIHLKQNWALSFFFQFPLNCNPHKTHLPLYILIRTYEEFAKYCYRPALTVTYMFTIGHRGRFLLAEISTPSHLSWMLSVVPGSPCPFIQLLYKMAFK
jgi:hypothetical protein